MNFLDQLYFGWKRIVNLICHTILIKKSTLKSLSTLATFNMSSQGSTRYTYSPPDISLRFLVVRGKDGVTHI